MSDWHEGTIPELRKAVSETAESRTTTQWVQQGKRERIVNRRKRESSRTMFNITDKELIERQWLEEQGPRGERRDWNINFGYRKELVFNRREILLLSRLKGKMGEDADQCEDLRAVDRVGIWDLRTWWYILSGEAFGFCEKWGIRDLEEGVKGVETLSREMMAGGLIGLRDHGVEGAGERQRM